MRATESKPSATITFNRVAADNRLTSLDSTLTFAVRTDANYAIGGLREKVFQHVAGNDTGSPPETEKVRAILDEAYAEWGRNVISAMASSIDIANYGLDNSDSRHVDIHLHDAKFLSRQVVDHARQYMAGTGKDNVVYVSLDEMITGAGEQWADVGFSRLFSHDGKQQGDYVGRPGKSPLDRQIEELKERLAENARETGSRPSLVFLEDNVRHARTINWIIGEMDKAGVFEHGDLAAVSTCFCCASDEEQAKIVHNGKAIPVLSVVQYQNIKVDVITPRDLLFDGYVVEVKGGLSRLPGLFMDVEKLFKIRPDHVDSFKESVREACLKFCDDVHRHTGYNLKIQDLTPAQAMCEILGCQPTDLVTDVIKANSGQDVKAQPAHGPKSELVHS